ncbi:MAG: PEGA domain-containing protein [Mariniblastus sp.]|nr:PEGA domain-containing protein [Mariniblastus sp.]
MQTTKLAKLLVLIILVSSLTGCVQRRLIIRSQPEGAFVTIDRQPIGLTPLSVPYTYSGTREIQLEKDGYKTVKVQQRIDPTWYEKFPVSFVTENFWPREIRDERLLEFQLEPKTQVQENLLLDRANDLRYNVQRGTVTAPIN